jgi:hypothetical protein
MSGVSCDISWLTYRNGWSNLESCILLYIVYILVSLVAFNLYLVPTFFKSPTVPFSESPNSIAVVLDSKGSSSERYCYCSEPGPCGVN